MFCIECGKKLPDGALFCPNCGKQIQNSNAGHENDSNPLEDKGGIENSQKGERDHEWSEVFCERYPEIVTRTQDIKDLFIANKMEYAIAGVRTCLEYMVKTYSKACGLKADTEELSLADMITNLSTQGLLSYDEKRLLQTVRAESNEGHHVDIESGQTDIDEVQATIDKLWDVIKIFEEKETKTDFDFQMQQQNTPQENPNNYSDRRRYYGKWWDCYGHLIIVFNRNSAHKTQNRS